jgi:hypothetical protein
MFWDLGVDLVSLLLGKGFLQTEQNFFIWGNFSPITE